MISRNWAFFCLIILTIYSSGCKVNSLNDPIIISLVDQEFSFSFWENLQSQGNPLEVHFQTIENEDCTNATIVSSYQKNGTELNLTLFNILPPENCDIGMAPAIGMENFNSLTNRAYSVKIELQGVVINTGVITVSDEVYEVQMNQEIGISWQQNKLLRVPSSAIWGYITYEGNEQMLSAENSITEFKQNTSTFENSSGYYGHFEIENQTLTNIKDLPGDVATKVFIQSYHGPTYIIDEWVDNFRAEAIPGMELFLFDGEGNVW